MSTKWAFNAIESKDNVYTGNDCIKKFCESLREQKMNIVNFEKKKKKIY